MATCAETSARIAYSAYNEYTGTDAPKWSDADQSTRDLWDYVASNAVRGFTFADIFDANE